MLKKKLLLFAVIIFLLFGLLTYQSIKGEGRFIDFPIYPLRLIEKWSSSLIKSAENLINSYILIVGKEEENKKLLEKISGFEQEINKYVEAGKENERLRNILLLRSERPDYVASAEVFAGDPTNWFQTLWINKGAQDGIARDMVAVTPAGPVGRIHRVFDEGAHLMLITDVNSSVAVRLQSSRVEGILEGGGNNRCYLKYISKSIDIEIGERLITSGLDGIYPEGLLIGYVSGVEKKGDDIFQQIEIITSQDLTAVEEVAILK
jgi:rod shape-determining protein MreC